MHGCDAQMQALVPPCLLSLADIVVANSTKMLKEAHYSSLVGAEGRTSLEKESSLRGRPEDLTC